MFKKIFFGLIGLCSLGTTFAAVNLSLDTIVMAGGTGVYQYDSPSVSLVITNNGSNDATLTSVLTSGFITCSVGTDIVFFSNTIPVNNFRINSNSNIKFPITLSKLATQNLGDKSLICALSPYGGWLLSQGNFKLAYTVLERAGGRFDSFLDKVRDPVKEKIDGPIAELGIGGVKSFVYLLIDKFAVRLASIIGILFGLIALYKTMFSDDENSLSSIKGLIIWGAVGIMIILSAKFLGNTFYAILGNGEIAQAGVDGSLGFNGVVIISQIYDLMFTPLLNIGFYLMMSVLFVLLLIRVFSFLSSDSAEIRKKSMQIIISTTVGLFIIIASKQLVEGVYGKEELIRNREAVTVTDIGGAFLSDANIPIIYNIIQRVMGLAGFVILILIVLQTFKMLTNPTDEVNITNIRKTLFYALLGMLVIGAGYLIVNVLMVN